jgi:excinuclease ABC subunit C
MSEIFRRRDFSRLPRATGLFCLHDAANKALFAGAAENLKIEIERLLQGENAFSEQIESSEIYPTEENLPRELARLVRRKNPRFNLSLDEQMLYPHLKITDEKFPRLLVTRRVLNETDEYFGAFLPKTGVRIWLYVLNKLFRLRSCELDIRGGDLPAPCSMHTEKRCLAPCVDELLDAEEYAETVDLLGLFLRRDEAEIEKRLTAKIERLAENLEFESAARARDRLSSIREIFADRKMNLWLDDAVDTYFPEKNREETLVRLVTTRARRTLGFETFVFPAAENLPETFALSQVLWQFYQFHAPREIRVTKDFPGRQFFAESLSRQAGRRVKVSVVSEEEYRTAFFSLRRSRLDSELKKLSNLKTIEEIRADLQKIFSLPEKPRRIEAFDVAHISNEDFVAACAVWKDGKFDAAESGFWLLDSASEPQAMAEAVDLRLTENEKMPDLILLDGGRSQMKAVKRILKSENVKIIAAVKPNRRHGEISHFLTETGERIDFEADPVFEVLRNLRDEAHALANDIHRQRRETKLLAAQDRRSPVLVPIRFDERGGAAENFRLISKNEVLKKLIS